MKEEKYGMKNYISIGIVGFLQNSEYPIDSGPRQ
tara:strand:- start:317 stop:418 length:102 start_codon:yes stop_codon:yes gene_type:complete